MQAAGGQGHRAVARLRGPPRPAPGGLAPDALREGVVHAAGTCFGFYERKEVDGWTHHHPTPLDRQTDRPMRN